MRGHVRGTLSVLSALAIAAATSDARATDVDVAGKTMQIDLTNTSIVDWHFNNRNTVVGQPQTYVDDNYGEWLDRFNLQVAWWRLRAGIRFDTADYFGNVSHASVQSFVAKTFPNDPDPNDTANQYFRELHTRFIDTYYPSKLYVGYAQRGVDVTVGDFYVQLGRGLVFSVRKIDELAIDTTVRGVKAEFDRQVGDVHLGAMLFGGQMNPLRIDETSGRQLAAEPDALFFGFPGPRTLVTFGTDANGQITNVHDDGRPNYLEDSVVGGRVEAGTKDVAISGNLAYLLRDEHNQQYLDCVASGGAGCDALDIGRTGSSQLHDKIMNWSGAVSLPNLAERHADVYLEVAGQQMRDGAITNGVATNNINGYAVYGNATAHVGPMNVTLEGKNYRSFFPLAANVDQSTKGFSAPEFSILTYSQPPIAEPIYTEPVSGGAPNVCISGGWANVDGRYNPDVKLYGWLGYYTSWSDIDPNNCQTTSTKQTKTWDMATGVEIFAEKRKSSVRAWIGARTTDCVDANCGNAVSDKGSAYYREGYVRYDVIKHVSGPVSLELQGLHRHRYEPYSFQDPWNEGENYTALQWSPHYSLVFGYEYLGRVGCTPDPTVKLCHYVNGGFQWRAADTRSVLGHIFDTINLFVGQRRGGLRCISGICRQFPPFEGAKAEIVSRF